MSRFWKRKTLVLLVFILVLLLCGYYFYQHQNKYIKYASHPINSNERPQISGWIAWWAEDLGFENTYKHHNFVQKISPVWFLLNANLEIEDVGKINKQLEILKTKELNIRIYPTLGSELSPQEISYFLNDDKKTDALIGGLVKKLIEYKADGVDIDLENIKKEDKDKFSEFLKKISNELKEHDLKLSVAVHAQTEKVLWSGVEGQDLTEIGRVADEVRIMTYDEHTGDTEPGPISSFDWIYKVARYTETKIPREKIVFGIPSYGYVWTKNDTTGFQFNEFQNFLEGKSYKTERDKNSGEIIISGSDFKGWLSDSSAMISKINLLEHLGFKKFVIWHLGGMDESLFDNLQTTIK